MNWVSKVSDPEVCLLDHCCGRQHHLALVFKLVSNGPYVEWNKGLSKHMRPFLSLWIGLQAWEQHSCVFWKDGGVAVEKAAGVGMTVRCWEPLAGGREAGLWPCMAEGTSSRSRMPSFIIRYGQGSPAATRVLCPRKAVRHWVMETPACDSAHHGVCTIFCSDRLRMVSCRRGRYEQTSQSLLLLGGGAQAPGYAHFS